METCDQSVERISWPVREPGTGCANRGALYRSAKIRCVIKTFNHYRLPCSCIPYRVNKLLHACGLIRDLCAGSAGIGFAGVEGCFATALPTLPICCARGRSAEKRFVVQVEYDRGFVCEQFRDLLPHQR